MNQEESIFDAARQLPPGSERDALLDEACGDDARLRADIEQLLQAQDVAGSFLNRPASGVQLPEETVDFSSREDTVKSGNLGQYGLPGLQPCDTPGRLGKINEYEIIEPIGQGGMGSVLRAWDTKLQRMVAIKVMSGTLAASPEAVVRFLREARSAAAVVHDHIVKIYAIEDSVHPPLLVMEYVEGMTLRQKIANEGALRLEEIVELGRQVAEGLAAAHAAGLIHRDVKPANILLTEDPQEAKITDFGLARAADNLELTQTGVILGTPQYMSPEQARGEPVDHRSDLFSLGSVLYAMCTGKAGFASENTLGTINRVCNEQPTSIRELNPQIPPWMETLVNRLLSKDREDRYQSSSEVVEAFDLGRDGGVTSIDPNPQVRSRSGDSTKKRWLIAFGVATAAILILVLPKLKVEWFENDIPVAADLNPSSSIATRDSDQGTAIERLLSPEYGWTTPENLGPRINTKQADSQPTFSADGRSVAFSVSHQLYQARRESDAVPFTQGRPLSEPKWGKDPALSSDGLSVIYSFRVSEKPDYRLIFRQRVSLGSQWGKHRTLGPSVNSGLMDQQPIFSPDDLHLAFASGTKRSGLFPMVICHRDTINGDWKARQPIPQEGLNPEFGYIPAFTPDGELFLQHCREQTLHIATKGPDGRWIDHSIETPLLPEDRAVKFSRDLSTMYFSSKRPGGFGDLDIWETRRVLKSTLTVPR